MESNLQDHLVGLDGPGDGRLHLVAQELGLLVGPLEVNDGLVHVDSLEYLGHGLRRDVVRFNVQLCQVAVSLKKYMFISFTFNIQMIAFKEVDKNMAIIPNLLFLT